MSEAPRRPSHALAWTLVLAIPLLYLLGMPWVEIACRKIGHGAPPRAFEAFDAPYLWLIQHTPLGTPLMSYCNWCAHVSGMPS